MKETSGEYAAYVRRSTFQQENEHQNEDIRRWLERHDVEMNEVTFLSETASGASRNREKLRELLELVRNEDISHVVVWELSRIARDGLLAQEFFEACEEHDVTVHVTSGSVREIPPDGSNRLVADVMAAVYADERRTLIRRTRLGQERALNTGRWVGRPPLGFTTDADGYLIANIDLYEEFNADRDGFYTIVQALEQIDDGKSYRSVASDLICTRQALSKLYQDEHKRQWYLERETDDDRVQSALDELAEMES